MAAFSAAIPAALQKSIDSTKVEYVQLGRSGLRVSSPILGGMSFGSKKWMPWNLEEEDSLKILKAAYDRGVNTWDTADMYSNGLSEEIIGKAIKKFEIPREKLVLMTKCYVYVAEQVDTYGAVLGETMAKTKDYVNRGGLSRGAIFKAVEASLKRLGTDYIDVYQIHRYDPTTPPEETMKALHDLVESGKVRYIGASSMWATQFANMQFIAEKNGWTKFVSMQNYYNLLYREEEREMIRFCNDTGVGLIPYSPIAGGKLARPAGYDKSARSQMGPPLTDADLEIIKRVEEIAGKKGWKMSQVALAWLRSKGAVPINGFNSEERLDEACDVKDKTLDADEVKFLEEPYLPKSVVGHF
ncbi:NADP-dependent oxidoreductase domain-containing protein [Cadophora sp. MPI-SDFR-AT-0126]|nr:NADP-dependent oxidoreductase domain-containing protein [Leotiomycetes sp. MPI-SDFR-AT-0126]